jgi:hypothetical protein
MTLTFNEWLELEELPRLHRQFERADYFAFMEGLLWCCRNAHPLPDWIATIVIGQAEDVFAKGSRDRGKHGNWRATYNALQIDSTRAGMANLHLRARQRRGRLYVSALAKMYGYGREIPGDPVYNIVTRDDVFGFVSRELKGKPARGTPDAVKASYKASRRKGPKRKRRRKRLKRRRGGE